MAWQKWPIQGLGPTILLVGAIIDRPVILEQNHIGGADIFPALQVKSVISGEITADGRKGRPYERNVGAVGEFSVQHFIGCSIPGRG